MKIWIIERFQVYGRGCLLVAIFLSPLIFYRGILDAFGLTKMSVLLVLGVMALGIWFSWSAERSVWTPRFNLLAVAGVFLAACAISTLFSSNPALSLIGLYRRYGGFIPLALYAMVMALIVGFYWEKPEDLKDIARAAAAASIVMSAYVLIQAAGLDWIAWIDPQEGTAPSFPVGTMGNSNFAGGYLGVGVPFLAYLALTAESNLAKTGLAALVGLDLAAIWFTQTRGGMIGAGAGLLTMAFMYRHSLPRWVKAAAVSALLAAAALAVLVLWHPGMDRPPGPLARAKTFRTETFTIRTYFWQTAWRIFADHPVIGTGLDTYYGNYRRYRPAADVARYGYDISDKPHNIYLEYAANAGILGAGSYLALAGLAIWFALKQARRLEEPHRLLLVTFLAVLAAYMTQGFFSIDVPGLAVMGWVALGGIAAVADPAMMAARDRIKAREPKKAFKRKNRRESFRSNTGPAIRSGPALWPVHAIVAVIGAGLLVLGLRPILADRQAWYGNVRYRQNASADMVASYFERAITLNPNEPFYHTLFSNWLQRRAEAAKDPAQKKRLLAQALSHDRAVYRLHPDRTFSLIQVARVHTLRGEMIGLDGFAEADRIWERIVALTPPDWEIRYRHALMLDSWAEAAGGDLSIRRRGLQRLREVLRMRPDYVPAWIALGKSYKELGEQQKAREAYQQALALAPKNREARGLLAKLNAAAP